MDTCKQKWTVLERDVFSLLCLKAGEKLSQRDIAGLLSVSPTAVSGAVERLRKGNLLVVEKTKTVNFVSFNRDNRRAVELKRVENLKNVYVSGLSDYLENQLAGAAISLFGSYAWAEDTRSSDIDIAVIGRKHKVLQLGTYEGVLNRKINVNFYESWKKVDHHLRNNILSGIILHGGIQL